MKKIFCLLLLIAVCRVGAWAQVEQGRLNIREIENMNVHYQEQERPRMFIAPALDVMFDSVQSWWKAGLTVGWYLGKRGFRIDTEGSVLTSQEATLGYAIGYASFELPFFPNPEKMTFTPSVGIGIIFPAGFGFVPTVPFKCLLAYRVTKAFSIGVQASYNLLRIVNAPGLFSAGVVLGVRI